MRYSIILPWVTVVSAIPSLHHEFLLSGRDALAEPSFYNDAIQLEVRDAKGSSGLASAAFHEAGNLAKEYGPDVTRAIANNMNQQRQQQQQLQRRYPSWETAALHGAESLVKEYGPDVTRAIANNMNQQRQQQQQQQQPQQQRRRDPSFFKKLEHDAGAAAKFVAPLAIQYGPEIAGAALMARDPSFIKTAEHDASQALHTAGNLAYQYGPDVALAVLDHKSSKGEKRDLKFALYERDAEAEADVEAFYDALYERDAEAEADFEGLFERDAEPEDFYDELYVRNLGYFEEY